VPKLVRRDYQMAPEVKNMTMMVNSIYNGWRMGDVWLQTVRSMRSTRAGPGAWPQVR
jgi:hypothetical protein